MKLHLTSAIAAAIISAATVAHAAPVPIKSVEKELNSAITRRSDTQQHAEELVARGLTATLETVKSLGGTSAEAEDALGALTKSNSGLSGSRPTKVQLTPAKDEELLLHAHELKKSFKEGLIMREPSDSRIHVLGKDVKVEEIHEGLKRGVKIEFYDPLKLGLP